MSNPLNTTESPRTPAVEIPAQASECSSTRIAPSRWETRGRQAAGLLAALGFAVILGAIWHAARGVDSSAQDSAAVLDLMDAGQALRADIARIVTPAMTRTRKLAETPELISILQSGNRDELTRICNKAVTEATEIDAFALFDADGRIVAINNIYASGQPIAPERVQRILGLSFAGRDIIQKCTRNNANDQVLEFQTTCDITPAFFNSTGLSVAYSVPVRDSTGAKIGVASSRLRFERISDLIQARAVGGRPGSVQLVTDQGGYFSEEINGGHGSEPIPHAELKEIVAPLVHGETDRVLTRFTDNYLNIFRLTDFATLDNGGIQVMLMADKDWILREARQARWVQAGAISVAGFLILLPAILLRGMAQSARARRILETQKRNLQEHIQKRIRAEAERNRLQSSLVDASRRAGMAEIATGVLHNVGNALNSVNVSTSLTTERVRKLKVDSLSKACLMLGEHAADLPEFLTQDERGKHLPGFLEKYSGYLAGEQEFILTELRALGERVEHIKAIVSTQQTYAGMRGVAESISISNVIEDALRMTAEGCGRHQITVVRDLPTLPHVVADKHKILQILLNLLNNAKQAICEAPNAERTITVRTRTTGERLIVEVSDTGVGIPAENLTRIFAHGFTTKPNGHGFGLHSSANAAGEMNGSLRASSAGPGQGAKFELELPLTLAEAVK